MSPLSDRAYDDLRAKIGSPEVIAAFNLLVAGIAETKKFELLPNVLGQKKSLHFKSGSVSYFAFIANNEWLLWYFRRPGLRDGIFNYDDLQKIFPTLEFSKRSNSEKIEAIVRIRTLNEAASILSFVQDTISKL